ncbi:hypothetical protein [Pseudogemmobacter sp. W21_MBD1_M6]|jgi:hypothetical protein|uniref:hypothetical protein n=1 Tax=Pseudogemmobacter sp. W21_MBD1_M6 TaxID=3240271 RepID=UPI003F9E9A76
MRGVLRMVAFGAVLGMLAACDVGTGTQTTTQVTVSSAGVTIGGPAGFCVDRRSTTDSSTGSFVLLGSCAAIAGSATLQRPAAPALLMASVSGAGGGVSVADSFATLGTFFQSEQGRAALSRTGDPATVKVLDAAGQGDVFYVHARDTSAAIAQRADEEYWRAIFNVKGRIVSASVMGLKDRPISSDTARQILDRFVARIRALNAKVDGGVTRNVAPGLSH